MSGTAAVVSQTVALATISTDRGSASAVLTQQSPVAKLGVMQGAAGPPGNAVGMSFVISTPSTLWTLPHGLGRYPVVFCTDTAGETIFGDMKYLDANNIAIGFAYPTSGTAYLN